LSGDIILDYPINPFRDGPLSLGDTIDIFGPPLGVRICYAAEQINEPLVAIRFAGNVVVQEEDHDLSVTRILTIRPETSVNAILYNNTFEYTIESPWSGFKTISSDFVESCF